MVEEMKLPQFSDIISASEVLKGFAHRTPVLTSRMIDDIFSCNLYFKCENFQRAGAFKFRGAFNSVSNLDDQSAAKGVATHSSGNFAQALALAAKMRNIPAYIVMPETAPKAKVNAVKGYGANITFCKPTLEARESTLDNVVAETGAVFLHPYDNFHVIAGQGTSAFELLTDFPDIDTIIAPVGGGGLISGTATAAKAMRHDINVLAGEPQGADDAYRSFTTGEFVASVNPNTIADGLLTSLGKLTFPIIREKVDSVITVPDEITIEIMKLIFERMKLVIEPSSAVAVAAIYSQKEALKDRKIGIIISGGNLDLDNLPWQNNIVK